MAEVVLNLAIEKAIKEKKLDFINFTQTNEHQEYYEFFVNCSDVKGKRMKKTLMVDLNDIEDKMLLRRIVEFSWYGMNPKRRNPHGYYTGNVLRLKYFLEETDIKLKKDYNAFLNNAHGASECNYSKKCFEWGRRFYRFCLYEDNKKDPFKPDIWFLNKMNISPERINLSRNRKRLLFSGIKDKHNKKLVKEYIKYLLLNTDNSINTICFKLNSVKNCLNMVDKPYTEWDMKDAEVFVEKSKNNRKVKSIANMIMHMEDFTAYLIYHDIISDSPIKHFHELTHFIYEYKETASDQFVLTQIFNALGKIEDIARVICFLIIYCTGCRVSEACQVEKDCVEKQGDSYFIKFYNPKMKKYAWNIIPNALAELIMEYRITVPDKTPFLFYAKDYDMPMQAISFTEKLGEELKSFNIINSDGTPYRFSPHAFRHLMAVKMREADIPFQYISEQLHHKSPEMTLAYLEFVDKSKIAKMKKFYNAKGDLAPIISDDIQVSDQDYAIYMSKFINAQMLPGGICARPVKLGECKHCNKCLFCDDYRTSVEFLDYHRELLNRINESIEIAKRNGWIIQEKQALRTKEALENLIDKIMKDEGKNGIS